jgi:hypothetical protein
MNEIKNGDGRIPTFRADIGLRVVIDGSSYEHVGKLMDRIHLALARELRGEERAAFDFTHFHTHPCTGGQMAALADGAGEVYYEQPAIR